MEKWDVKYIMWLKSFDFIVYLNYLKKVFHFQKIDSVLVCKCLEKNFGKKCKKVSPIWQELLKYLAQTVNIYCLLLTVTELCLTNKSCLLISVKS